MARWRPAPGNFSQKGEKTCHHCDVTTRNLKPNTKKCLNQNQKTCSIRRGFQQLSNFIGREVMTEQSYSHCSGFAVFQRRGKAKFVNVIQHTRSCSLL